MLCATMAWAGPARDVVIKHIQPDGTELSLHLVGDEYMHYYVNLADGQKMRQGEDGHFYTIAQSEMQKIQDAAGTKRKSDQQHRVQRVGRTHRMSTIESATPMNMSNKLTGQKKGLVILVNFADLSINTNHTQSVFNDRFNQNGYNKDGHIGSVKDYFKDQSYGNLSIEFDVVGPVTLSQNLSFYGENDANGHDKGRGYMVMEACQAVDRQVDFSKYDWDGDKEVDQVIVIYAGYSEAYGADENSIWPCCWTLSEASSWEKTGAMPLTLDGVKIDQFACASELAFSAGSELDGIGTVCHEFSHCLGLPDFYDTDFSGGIGMGFFDLMGQGEYNGPNKKGEVPAGYSAYERWFFGWLEPRIINSDVQITNMFDLGGAPISYIIYNSSNTNEFLLLENRQCKDWFSYYGEDTAGHGLFITHIDFDNYIWGNNKPNDDPKHQRMTWVPADKNYQSGHTNDFFPGSDNVTTFIPSLWDTAGGMWYTTNGDSYSTHSLSEITEDTTTGTISFLFDALYSIIFNAGAGHCETETWTQPTSETCQMTLPTATINSDEWTFAGWSTSYVTEATNAPTLFLAEDTYDLSKSQTLFAVYKKNITDVQGWQIVSDPTTLSDGIYAICTPDGYAFNGTIRHGSGGLTKEKFVLNNDGIAETAPNGICEIIISASNGHFSMYNSEKGYLYIAKADYGCLNWSNAKVSKWKIDNSNWAYQIRKDAYAYLKSNSDPKIVSASQVTKNSVIFVQKLTSQTTLYATNPSLK